MKLLIVDDDVDLLASLIEVAELFGIEVHAVPSLVALERTLSVALSCDAALLDLELGDANGLEVLTRLRASDFERPVRFMTNHELDHPLAREAASKNGEPPFRKPFEFTLLGKLIR